MRFLAYVSILLLAIAGSLAAAPIPGGEDVGALYSPLFLAGAPSVTSTASPEADAINPAASGGAQRAVLDLSYIALADLASSTYEGTALNLGATYPTNFGVYSGSAHFLTTAASSPLYYGTLGTLNLSFSKDLYSNFLVGAGLGLTVGSADEADWGLGLDLGFIDMPGDIGVLKDFRWGAALDNIGKGYYGYGSSALAVPAAFTPAVGAAFTLVRTKPVGLELNSDLSFPSFQDVRLDLGTTIDFGEFMSVHLATAVSTSNLLPYGAPETPGRWFPIAGGITFDFKTNLPSNLKYLADKGWTRSEIDPTVAFAPLANNVTAIGAGVNVPLGQIDRTPPDITVTYPSEQYISPKNTGSHDYLDVPITITDNRFVYGYRFKVYDADGTLVREIDNPDYRPESKGIQNVLDRLAAVKSGIPIPPTFRWDGRDNLGKVVPDGAYAFTVTAWDENGNLATTSSYPVVVKVTPPRLDLKQLTGDDLIFSPNGVGLKNSIEITETGSTEDRWQGQFVNASGKAVRTIAWTNSAPQSFLWDGKDDSGQIVPDGVYAYSVSATDKAGNTTQGNIQNIIVDTTPTPVGLSINPAAFAPGTKSPIQTITFTFDVPVRTDIVSWSFQVVDSTGAEVRRLDGNGADLPSVYVYDGKDDGGNYLKEGSYRGDLSVLYRNGHNPTAQSPEITVDLTPPSATLTADYLVFSPIPGSPRPEMLFHSTASSEQTWTGSVDTADGTTVKTFSWIGTPDPVIAWDGRGDDGRLEPDGTYLFSLDSIDEAGNFGQSNTISFTLDTEKKQVFLNTDYDAFSPNGARSVIHLVPQLRTTNGFVSYSFDVVDQSGAVQTSVSGTTPPAGPFAWDGKRADGSAAPDGLYRGEITVSYSNGTSPKATTSWFELLTKMPTVTAQANYLLFSPNGDGYKDTVTLTQSSSTTTTVWTGKILRSDGQTVKEWRWPGAVQTVVWDGTDTFGNTVHDGAYSYVVSTVDAAGNSAQAEIDNIVVDDRPTHAFVTVDKSGFSPTANASLQTVTFTNLVTLPEGIGSWDLAMVLSDGTVVKDFRGGASVPTPSIVWDGKGDDGQIHEGTYTGRLTVTYNKGDVDIATTRSFVLDVSPPATTVDLSPLPFTPDNSGVADILTIAIKVASPVDVATWNFQIFDPTNQPFYAFSGSGLPASALYWNGLSTSGELVQSAQDYPYTLTVTDVLGNVAVVKGKIPTGILVMKEGDRYLIQISSINFAPFSAALISQQEDPVLYARNNEVLDQIAKTLKTYGSYQIRLEGNAVSVYWADPAQAAVEQRDTLIPLSLARAETVKQALVQRGVSAARMSTVGLGASNPIVPFSDTVNLWKDRRVDFVLLK